MANLLSPRSSAACQLALGLLIGCLFMHFVVEDVFLVADSTALTQSSSGASSLIFEEMVHLDDILLLTEQPVVILHRTVPPVFAWAVPLAKLALPAIITPPKI